MKLAKKKLFISNFLCSVYRLCIFTYFKKLIYPYERLVRTISWNIKKKIYHKATVKPLCGKFNKMRPYVNEMLRIESVATFHRKHLKLYGKLVKLFHLFEQKQTKVVYSFLRYKLTLMQEKCKGISSSATSFLYKIGAQ